MFLKIIEEIWPFHTLFLLKLNSDSIKFFLRKIYTVFPWTMAAYAALVSLMHIVDTIEHHHSPPISIHKQQLESLTQIISFLQEFLDGYKSPVADGDEADPLEMRIADAAYAAEDAIESHIVDVIKLGISTSNEVSFFYEDLQQVIEELNVIKKEAIESSAEAQLQRKVSSTHAGSLTSSSNVKESMMVGFDDVQLQLLDWLTGGNCKRQIISIVGMGGIGKTTLARHIFEHAIVKENFDIRLIYTPNLSSVNVQSDRIFTIHTVLNCLISSQPHIQTLWACYHLATVACMIYEKYYMFTIPNIKKVSMIVFLWIDYLRFDVCAWATISQQYNTREILCELVSQATNKSKEQLSEKSEDELGLELYQHLIGRRFLIVMDDMWSIDAWDRIQRFFPENENCSRILVTTRLLHLSSQLNNNYSLQMEFLDEVRSGELFSKTVFGVGSCPHELEKIGKKIVENCRGLPLSIVVVAGILRNREHTLGVWESISQNLASEVNLDNEKFCMELLKMSYNNLPVYLKPCFLYMRVFEEDDSVRVSTLVKLWVSEGFLKPMNGKSLETIAIEFLKDLVDRNLILVGEVGKTGNIKLVKIHDLLRDLCLNQSKKDGFYHVIGQSSPRGMSSQRRVVIPRNMPKKKVLDDLQSMPRARSIISEYVYVSLRIENGSILRIKNSGLLRTLHAYRKFGYFGDGSYVVKSLVSRYVNLRHLVVKVGSMSSIFTSFTRFWNLHILIVSCWNEFTAPAEIWRMPQLRHIEMIRGRFYLPEPSSDDVVVMENLLVLDGIANFKCNEEVVKRIPKYQKIEDRVLAAPYALTFPQSLKKLTLEMNRGFEWEKILEKIGSMPLLEKFKLLEGCFETGKWEMVEGQFPSLKYLELFACLNLKHWTAESSSIFPRLEKLSLDLMEELKEIPTQIGDIPTLQKIWVNYCGESAVMCAKEIVEEQVELQGEDLPFRVKVWIPRENEAVQSLAGPNFEVILLGFTIFLQQSLSSPSFTMNTPKKKVLDNLQSMPRARSIISEYGNVPRIKHSGLLRTLHAYKFPYFEDESHVIKSLASQYVNLRHLAVEVGSMSSIFTSFTRLWNLHILIVSCFEEFTAPAEIWRMPQLRHIEMTERNFYLPEPSSDDVVVMENLLVLERIANFKCSEEVVKRIPNIKKLVLDYFGSGGIEQDDYYCLNNIKRLCKLESLHVDCWFDFRAAPYALTFPQSLKKLTLEMNRSLEWEKILEKIGSMPLLEKFMLWNGCFGTGKWEMVEGQFPSLKYLELHRCPSLKHWTAESNSIFPRLEKLDLFDMRQLKEIPTQIGDIPTLQKIWMRDCGESAVMWAKEIVEEQGELQGEDLPFHVQVFLWRENEAVQIELGRPQLRSYM
ncbi:putative late blight resistance protein homolog R1A-4 [Salvia miltiorrhiza]|uniref:putative late blight resistance protein homolog R1A-4 n=1 Tax=Salvia miltiorrhiza TaxID=226208 RepID=UPI0025AD7689|nr:putative late blight resistance protein homolog R1A-4 [Salvia miltiorrhiza]